MLKNWLRQWRDRYVQDQAWQVPLPEFGDSPRVRRRVRFSGRVQNVGFRMEVCQLSSRLGLTGWCENLPDGDVLAELQGPENRILFVISFMESLKRICITEKRMEALPPVPGERDFRQR